jgi:transcriptional regulator with XRE-family HTH domain
MAQRTITTGRQLGAAIHDARTRAGMTQAALALRAGVSRKWLIGLEQGARTGAELGKVLDVLRALNLSIQLFEEPEKTVATRAQSDVEVAAPTAVMDQDSADPKASTLSTSQALTALEAMRQVTAPSRTILEAMRQATQLPPHTLEAIRQATTSSATVLEAMRQATQLPPHTLEAIRQATASSTTVLEAMRQVQLSQSALEAVRRTQDDEE